MNDQFDIVIKFELESHWLYILKRCAKKTADWSGFSILKIRFLTSYSRKAFDACLSLDGHKVPAPCYETASDPVRIVSGNQVYELVKGLPVTVIKDLIRGKTIPYDEFDRTLEKFSRYAGKLSLNIPGRPKKLNRHASFTPVLDFDPGLKYADLGFEYKGIGLLPMTDTWQVLLNHETNLELHKNFAEEQKYRDMLKSHGAVFISNGPKECFIPEGKKETLL